MDKTINSETPKGSKEGSGFPGGETTGFFKNMVISDAVSHQRTMNVAREAITKKLLKASDDLAVNELLELMKSLDSTPVVEQYVELVKLIK